jgi:hypothetical protein
MVVLAFIAVMAVTGIGGSVYTVRKLRAIAQRRKEWKAADDFVMAAGAGGASLVDLYLVSEHHEQALANLHHIYSHAIPADASPLTWASYFEEHAQEGPRHIQGVVNAWQGTLAEHQTVETLNADPLLREHGITAHQFDAPNHPGTDIYFADSHGHALSHTQVEGLGLPDQLQVKSYAADNVHNFLDQVHQHPNLDYVVNHELYDHLASSGTLDHLSGHVIDGGFSTDALHDQAKSVIGDFHQAQDVAHHVPFVAVGMFGYKTARNLRELVKGNQSFSEAGVNITADGVRVGVGGMAAFGGAKIGGPYRVHDSTGSWHNNRRRCRRARCWFGCNKALQ